MTKLKVTKDLAMFFDNYYDMIGDDSTSFEIIHDLINDLNYNLFEDDTKEFIHLNMNEIFEVISGKREYEVEKEEFYALIKGHEKVQGTPHWAYNGAQEGFTINYYSGYPGVNIKMTKDEWEELGINDSNACFSTSLD